MICHSTSWRFDKTINEIILTYIVFQSDIYIEHGQLISINPYIIKHGSSYHPSPKTILINEVLMHGLRHLEFLINEHEVSVPAEVFKLLALLRINLAGQF